MNTFRFRLHDWELEIRTETPKYIQALRHYFPYYLGNSSKENQHKRVPATRKICFKIYLCTGQERGTNPELNKNALFWLRRIGFCRIVNAKAGNVSIFLNPERETSEHFIYHAAFLDPLCLVLLRFHAALVHASLVSKQNSGILIAGRSGSGKSTL